jgi:2-polyprenyl-6-hydroxyphenyl methylase/3-demethylubiquinone-9 3-methyltransferase
MRTVDPRELCHERLADRFADLLSSYDTLRRVETLVDEFLPSSRIDGADTLDVGCGLGYFSERLQQAGARVTACDLGPRLLELTRQRVGCECVEADALDLVTQFGRDRFDVVVSSECIEHTPDPRQALQQMATVLKPGGLLAVSTPNRVWQPAVQVATRLGLRPFDGYERFLTWGDVRSTLRGAGLDIIREQGLHLFPFQFRLHGLSRWCDRRLQVLRAGMINLCVLAEKPRRAAEKPGSAAA